MHTLPLRAARSLAAFAGVVLAASLVACSSDNDGATEPVSGNGLVYNLATVDNRSVPALVTITTATGAATVSVARGKLTLAADSTWILSHVITANISSSVATLRGTYTRTGQVLTLKQQANASFVGTWSENAVSISADTSIAVIGSSFTYTR